MGTEDEIASKLSAIKRINEKSSTFRLSQVSTLPFLNGHQPLKNGSREELRKKLLENVNSLSLASFLCKPLTDSHPSAGEQMLKRLKEINELLHALGWLNQNRIRAEQQTHQLMSLLAFSPSRRRKLTVSTTITPPGQLNEMENPYSLKKIQAEASKIIRTIDLDAQLPPSENKELNHCFSVLSEITLFREQVSLNAFDDAETYNIDKSNIDKSLKDESSLYVNPPPYSILG